MILSNYETSNIILFCFDTTIIVYSCRNQVFEGAVNLRQCCSIQNLYRHGPTVKYTADSRTKKKITYTYTSIFGIKGDPTNHGNNFTYPCTDQFLLILITIIYFVRSRPYQIK